MIVDPPSADPSSASPDASTASSPTVEGTHRRRLLVTAGTGLGAAAIAGALGPLGHLLPAAAASSDESPEIALATFLTGIELSVIDLYDLAGKTGKLTADTTSLAKTFRQHHQAHSTELASLVTDGGGTPPTSGNAALTAQETPKISGAADATALANVLGALEDSLAATYLASLRVFVSSALASTAAQILPVDAQQAVAWSAATNPGGNPPHQPAASEVPPLQTTDGALTVASLGTSLSPTTTGTAS